MNKKPIWLTVAICVGLVGTFGGFIAAVFYAQLFIPAGQKQMPPLGGKLVCLAIISLGWTVIMGMINVILIGSYYSGFRRGKVSRTDDPVHFWLLLGTGSLFPLTLMIYGAFKFISL